MATISCSPHAKHFILCHILSHSDNIFQPTSVQSHWLKLMTDDQQKSADTVIPSADIIKRSKLLMCYTKVDRCQPIFVGWQKISGLSAKHVWKPASANLSAGILLHHSTMAHIQKHPNLWLGSWKHWNIETHITLWKKCVIYDHAIINYQNGEADDREG